MATYGGQFTLTIEAIEKPLSSLPYSLSRHILEHLRKLTSHEPVIGIMGKSGAGKSSLCNALFQGEVTPVSDVHAGTREVRRFRLSGHGHSMIITDLPGWASEPPRVSWRVFYL
ncbi:putative GTP-binding protein [Escherichia coli]|nr:putative GTP-binding protein [Escherichia coli]